MFEFTLKQKNDDFSQVEIIGEINAATSRNFEAALDFIVKNGKSNIDIDCSKLEYLDSAGLRVLDDVLNRIMGSGRHICFINMKGYIKKIFITTRMDTYFIFKNSDSEVA